MPTKELPQGLIISRYTKHFDVIIEQKPEQIYQCVARTDARDSVAGDIVNFCPEKKVITQRIPRKNLLQRPDNYGKIKAVAANIDQMLITIAHQPAPQSLLIDSYLVAARLLNLDACIIVNKTDLIGKDICAIVEIYRALPYPIIFTSCASASKKAVLDCQAVLKNNTSIVVGQSGVGKSSLINCILPLANNKVSKLTHNQQGKHTTVQAKLFLLKNNAKLIDSPGIREFSLWHITQQDVQHGFIEIAQYAQQCRFRDCQHDNEPQCAVKKAVSKQHIHAQRFENFCAIKDAITQSQFH